MFLGILQSTFFDFICTPLLDDYRVAFTISNLVQLPRLTGIKKITTSGKEKHNINSTVGQTSLESALWPVDLSQQRNRYWFAHKSGNLLPIRLRRIF